MCVLRTQVVAGLVRYHFNAPTVRGHVLEGAVDIAIRHAEGCAAAQHIAPGDPTTARVAEQVRKVSIEARARYTELIELITGVGKGVRTWYVPHEHFAQ